MANIPIRDIPGAVVDSPNPSNLIPMDNGSIMQKTTIANAVNTTLPLSSQAEAEAGVDNAKRMSPLRTKQAIDAQATTIVNTAIMALNLGTMSQEAASDYTPTSGLGAVALSNDYNDLDNLPTLGTAAATNASDYATAAQGSLADSSIQPGDNRLVPSGGTTGQVLVKLSNADNDDGWQSIAGSGDVVGPASSVDSRMVEFDGTSGKLIKDGGVVVSAFMKTALDDADAATARATLGAQQDLGWKPIGVTEVSSPSATPIVIALPTGAKALRLTGKIKLSTTADAVAMTISVNGGVSYFSTSGDYTQAGQFTIGTSVTATDLAATAAITLANANGNADIPTQFTAQLDTGDGLPVFNIENVHATGLRKTYGYSAATSAVVTHVRLTPTGTASFAVGTRFISEAF